MAGVWDKPDLILTDLTREQLIEHCQREAVWHRVHGRATMMSYERRSNV